MGKWKRGLIALTVVLLLAVQAVDAQDTAQEPTVPLAVAQNLLESGRSAVQNQDYDRALLDLSVFIYLNPNFSQAYYWRGLAYAGRGDADAALDDLEAAIRYAYEDVYQPAYRAALFETTARIHVSVEDFAAAEVAVSGALDINPTVDNYVFRALLRSRLAAYDDALADMDAAVALADAEALPSLYLTRASINVSRADVTAAAADYYAYIQSIETETQRGGSLANGGLVELEMAQGRVYRITVPLERGQLLTLLASPAEDSAVDPLLVLLSPDDTPVIASDDVQPPDLTALVQGYTVPADGDYTLVISHAAGGSDGPLLAGYRTE